MATDNAELPIVHTPPQGPAVDAWNDRKEHDDATERRLRREEGLAPTSKGENIGDANEMVGKDASAFAVGEPVAAEHPAGQQGGAAMTAQTPVADPVERVARALCLVRGQDPEENAPIRVVCGSNNQPVPHWMAFEEEARAAIAVIAEGVALLRTEISTISARLVGATARAETAEVKLAEVEKDRNRLKELLSLAGHLLAEASANQCDCVRPPGCYGSAALPASQADGEKHDGA